MKIDEVSKKCEPDGVTLSCLVKRHATDRPPIDLYYTFHGVSPSDVDGSADPFAVACLIKSMRINEPLEIKPPISNRLHVMLPRVRDIYHAWWPDLFKSVEIRTTPRAEQDPLPMNTVGTFFSGGVDSFYSLLKHHRNGVVTGRPLTHMVFMRGVETSIERTKGVEDSEEWCRSVADSLGIRAIFGITNVRTHIMTNWEKYDHGSALASIGLCLSPILGHICIPSAFSYRHLIPHGSSPLTDEMFSSDRMYVFHDGSEVSRAEKIESIVGWDKNISMRYLRVCLGNLGGAYNCGRCRKCVRTAIPLKILGVLQEFEIFKNKGEDHWRDFIAKDHLELLRENFEFAKRHDANSEISQILNCALKQRRFEQALGELRSITFENEANMIGDA